MPQSGKPPGTLHMSWSVSTLLAQVLLLKIAGH